MKIRLRLCITKNILALAPKNFVFGNNHIMRETGQDLNATKERVKKLLEVPALIKIRGGRGKCETMNGKVSALFPAVFTIAFEDGSTKTFPYADVHTGNILFLKQKD